jgi:hypothetical protein
MRGLLSAQRSAKNPREAQHRLTATAVTLRRVVLTDQLTFNTKDGSLQFDETDVLPRELFCHGALIPQIFEKQKNKWGNAKQEVPGLVQGCG